MTRKDLIDKVAKEFGLKKKDAEAIVKFIFSEITEALKKDERVSIQGFGVFEVRELKARRIRIPRSNKIVVVPNKKRIVFIPKLLKKNF